MSDSIPPYDEFQMDEFQMKERATPIAPPPKKLLRALSGRDPNEPSRAAELPPPGPVMPETLELIDLGEEESGLRLETALAKPSLADGSAAFAPPDMGIPEEASLEIDAPAPRHSAPTLAVDPDPAWVDRSRSGTAGVHSVSARWSFFELFLCAILLVACLAAFYAWVVTPLPIAY